MSEGKLTENKAINAVKCLLGSVTYSLPGLPHKSILSGWGGRRVPTLNPIIKGTGTTQLDDSIHLNTRGDSRARGARFSCGSREEGKILGVHMCIYYNQQGWAEWFRDGASMFLWHAARGTYPCAGRRAPGTSWTLLFLQLLANVTAPWHLSHIHAHTHNIKHDTTEANACSMKETHIWDAAPVKDLLWMNANVQKGDTSNFLKPHVVPFPCPLRGLKLYEPKQAPKGNRKANASTKSMWTVREFKKRVKSLEPFSLLSQVKKGPHSIPVTWVISEATAFDEHCSKMCLWLVLAAKVTRISRASKLVCRRTRSQKGRWLILSEAL